MNRARRWGHAKTAGFFGQGLPQRSQVSEFHQDSQISGLLESHFPVEYARGIIRGAPGVSFQDKVRLDAAVTAAAARTSPSADLVGMGTWLPAAVGAGLGLVGATLTAPIFGFTPTQKRMYGIGAGALGAVLNTYGRD